ncbi:TspO/MBR family protein [Amycolatopsis regifaucium]|uniref:Peripheral-type benzodiazepine receptor n=1 Tax=Amycolatopsis regifaucium TaxID=546365 RepID=A0A154MAC9_9PSEU|nr:TspO/MBR family protein [Amycolatopsis regifaucium]KZB81486.1 peripheral-type benzodiazepine receptor [Amycolatopsis regifaucium]OKA06944.1 tryptophan-rich sensory protein [Amycolatopsis regifaucium]SFH30157.1 TspO and MBR related proteins [Amycolatopsis regifaucium]
MTPIPQRLRTPLAFLPFLAAVAVAALVGGLAASDARSVYSGLDLPPFAPPAWLFGPVWTVLYLGIAVSGWLYWKSGGERRGLVWYAVQLALNALWTPLFFAAGAYGLALADIILLDIAIVVTALHFRRSSPVSAALLLPYLAWTCYATALNIAIVALN